MPPFAPPFVLQLVPVVAVVVVAVVVAVGEVEEEVAGAGALVAVPPRPFPIDALLVVLFACAVLPCGWLLLAPPRPPAAPPPAHLEMGVPALRATLEIQVVYAWVIELLAGLPPFSIALVKLFFVVGGAS